MDSKKNDGKIKEVEDIFKDSSLRVIGIVGNANEAKSNLIYHMIDIMNKKYSSPKMYSYGLRTRIEGVQDIHRVAELEVINNSVIFIDEFYDFLRLSNRKSAERAEESLRTVYHSNNILVLCGLPHNFGKFISGLMQVVIFKQSNLEDFIQRSSIQQFTVSYSGGFNVKKGQALLKMDKNIALVWVGGEFCYEVEIPYVESGDSKRFNKPILVEKIKTK